MLSAESLKQIDTELAKYPADRRRSAIMGALRIAQTEKGWLAPETIEFVADYIGIPPVQAYEVATFYNMYDLKPVGKYKLTVCTNLPCALRGGVDAGEYLKKKLGIGYGETLLPGTTGSVGEYVVMSLIWIFTYGMLRIYCPRQPEHARRVLLFGLVLNFLPWGVSALFFPFDISWVQIGGMALLIAYLGTQWLGQRVRTFLLISIFSIGSVGFLYASDYALNNVLKDYQRTRIKVLLGVEEDRDASYNVNQSKIAIGSGGLRGKGFMNGTQTKLDYVPEQDTDFIFCTVGEEEGFLGASAVLLLFLALILRLVVLAERQPTTFGRVFGYSVLSILLFHVFINIGMVTGLAPVIGIPLPFFSYGGSSLWGFTLLLFIFLRIDAGRKRR